MISRLDQFVIVIVLVAVLASNRCFQCSSAIAQTCSSLESEWYSSGNVIFFLITTLSGFAPIFPDTCYHLTHYWPAAADIPVASDNPVHYAGAIRYNARTPLQGSLLPLTRLV